MNAQRQRQIEGAKRYASAMKSDPFAFNRAMSHINNGVCSLTDKGHDAHYDAMISPVTRTLPDGVAFSDGSRKWIGIEYVDMKVPCA